MKKTFNLRKTLRMGTMIAAALFSSVSLHAAEVSTITPDQALASLMAGNENFTHGNLAALDANSSVRMRKEGSAGQHPYAVILTCSDSRLSPEILFGKGLGEVFVIRVAGNVVAPHELGSIEYAIEHLGSPLIMVLGHEKCGAVTAAFNATGPVEGNIGSIIDAIMPAVEKTKTLGGGIEECVTENITLVKESLELQSTVIKEFVETGKVKIVSAKYTFDSGVVQLLSQ